MASDVANTTAVWNCQIRDEDGDFIGPHGDIERYRELLGPCARTLEAGELIWMTDRTPHESLPVPVPVQPDGSPVRRQYFRLVIGEVTAWYADHSTANPVGVALPVSVRVVHGDKHVVYPRSACAPSWHCGDPAAIQAAHYRERMRVVLYRAGAGHAYERFLECGVRNMEDLLQFESQHHAGNNKDYYQLRSICRKLSEKYGCEMKNDVFENVTTLDDTK